MKLSSRILMVFGRNLRDKRLILVSEPHFREVRDNARPWLMACWKIRGQLCIR